MTHPQSSQQAPPPIQDILFPTSGNPASKNSNSVIADTTLHRAVHKIRLQSLAHNFAQVESAANRQRCSVIVVVKADGYGHGAIPTAIFLADTIGADAFAVATLEEAIVLRKALQQTAREAPGDVGLLNRLGNHHPNVATSSTVHNNHNSVLKDNVSVGGGGGNNDTVSLLFGPPPPGRSRRRSLRQGHIRILVLGPPVGFPRCFDDYYHHNIEVMISGPEVAKALLEWVLNKAERMRKQVERAAAEAKELILNDQHHHPTNGAAVTAAAAAASRPKYLQNRDSTSSAGGADGASIVSGGGGGNDIQSLASSTKSGQSSSIESSGLQQQQQLATTQQYLPPSATLSNVTGSDLAKEVRNILRNQKLAEQQQQHLNHPQSVTSRKSSTLTNGTSSGGSGTSSAVSSSQDLTVVTTTQRTTQLSGGGGTCSTTMTATTVASSTTSGVAPPPASMGVASVQTFAGIEEAAKYSRTRQKAIASGVFYEDEDETENNDDNDAVKSNSNDPLQSRDIDSLLAKSSDGGDSLVDATNEKPKTKNGISRRNPKARIPTNTNRNALPVVAPPKKRLRWHALVDSGMGRLGFRTEPVTKEDQGKRRDSVEIIKELVDLEVTLDCPIEFFGMCTHMADASSTSTYTHDQITKFKSLLRRVRGAGISVPTISTDNSAALLTTNLTHFDAKELLTQADADTRGFVRTGGAIYGQRPAFTQLQAVSTLMASVRHLAILKEGESVGYDRAYVAPRNVRIATLTIGFADGYPRELGNGVGRVSIRGHLFPVAGNVCMDMLMVELGPAEDRYGAGAQVVVGDTAILWGPDDGEDYGEGHVPLKELAATLKTTQSALTCGLNKERVLRQYT
jgi:alanine racemase